MIKGILEEWTKFIPPRPGLKYSSMMELVLKEGELLSKEPFTVDEEDFLLHLFTWLPSKPIPLKSCYQTAFRLASDAEMTAVKTSHTLEYGEGYAIESTLGIPLPIEHAVFVLNGKPVDLVWRDYKNGLYVRSINGFLKRAKWCLNNNEYYMIRLPIEYMEKTILAKGTYGVLEFNREIIEKGSEAWKNLA